MNKQKQLNLTEGPILKTLSTLALPIMASSFLNTAYNITDMAWIGVLGSKAVAGVGVGGMYVWFSQGFVTLARMGGQVHAAQSIGRKNMKDARAYAVAALHITLLLGLLFSIACLLFTDGLVGFFKLNDAETTGMASIYLKITCGMILIPYLNSTLIGLFTAQGDSQTPLKANLIGLILNMILDPILILGIGPVPRLGVAGAAIATVTSQLIVLLVLIKSILHTKEEAHILRKLPLLSKVPSIYYKAICKIGIPSAIQSLIYSGISMILTQMVAGFGAGAVATQRVGGQIESVSWNTAEGFGSALNAFTGQNLGAKKNDRIKKGYTISFWVLLTWGCLVTAAFVFAPGAISRVFFHEPEVITISVDYMKIIGYGQVFMAIELMTVGALSGLGMTRFCSIVTTIFTAARVPLAVLFIHMGMGLNGVWWALTISSIFKGIIYVISFHFITKRLDKHT